MYTRFILIEPSHAGNVGAVARAMKTMGFDELVLVRPRWSNVLRRAETIQRASGANDVLRNCQIVDDFASACEGVHFLYATAMVARDFGLAIQAPREAFEGLIPSLKAQSRVGLVFGNERFGMQNKDVYRCNACLQIPTNPCFGSLNLAAAVQLLAYEWRMALGGFSLQTSPDMNKQTLPLIADAQAIAATLMHWEQALVHIDFLDPKSPKKLLPRLHVLLARAGLRNDEVSVLRGIAKAVLQTDSGAAPIKARTQPASVCPEHPKKP